MPGHRFRWLSFIVLNHKENKDEFIDSKHFLNWYFFKHPSGHDYTLYPTSLKDSDNYLIVYATQNLRTSANKKDKSIRLNVSVINSNSATNRGSFSKTWFMKSLKTFLRKYRRNPTHPLSSGLSKHNYAKSSHSKVNTQWSFKKSRVKSILLFW